MPSSARSSPAAKPGRERDDETILFWHRGLSLSDIALGKAMLAKAQAQRHRPAAALRVSARRSHRRRHRRRGRRGGRPRGAHGRGRAGSHGAAAQGARACSTMPPPPARRIYGLNTGLGANLGTAVERRCRRLPAPVAGRAQRRGRRSAADRHRPRDDVCPRGHAVGRRLRHLARHFRRAGRRAECRRASRHAVARLDRRRRPRADGGARPHADRRRRGRISGPAPAGRRGAGDGRACAGRACAQGRAVADQRLGRLRRPRRAGRGRRAGRIRPAAAGRRADHGRRSAPTAPSSIRACRPPGPPPGRKRRREQLRDLLAGGTSRRRRRLQDPLSIRCMPSIHGALLAAIEQARGAVEIELNSAADNPLVLADDDAVHVDRQFPHGGAGARLRDARPRDRAGGRGERRPLHPADRRRPQRPAEISVAGRRRLGRLRAAAEDRRRDPRRDPPQGQSGDAGLPAGLGRRRGPCHADAAGDRQMRRDDRAVAAPDRLRADGCRAGRRSQDRPALGAGHRKVHAAVRALVAPLSEDRPLGADAEALYAALSSGKWQA